MTQSFESSILSVEEEESTLVLPHSQSVDDNLILEGMIKIIQYRKFYLCTFEWNGSALCASIIKYM